MIIDTHVHIGGEKVGFFMTEEKVLEAMDKYNIDYALVPMPMQQRWTMNRI